MPTPANTPDEEGDVWKQPLEEEGDEARAAARTPSEDLHEGEADGEACEACGGGGAPALLVRRDELAAHLASCPFQIIECPHTGCGARVQRRLLEAHVQVRSRREGVGTRGDWLGRLSSG